MGNSGPTLDNVRNLRAPRMPVDGGGSGGDDGGMEARLSALEQAVPEVRDRLTRIEARMDMFAQTFASKEDLHREISSQTWRLVTFVCGFGGVLVAATYFIAKHLG